MQRVKIAEGRVEFAALAVTGDADGDIVGQVVDGAVHAVVAGEAARGIVVGGDSTALPDGTRPYHVIDTVGLFVSETEQERARSGRTVGGARDTLRVRAPLRPDVDVVVEAVQVAEQRLGGTLRPKGGTCGAAVVAAPRLAPLDFWV